MLLQRIEFARTKSDAVAKLDGSYKPDKERKKKGEAARGEGGGGLREMGWAKQGSPRPQETAGHSRAGQRRGGEKVGAGMAREKQHVVVGGGRQWCREWR